MLRIMKSPRLSTVIAAVLVLTAVIIATLVAETKNSSVNAMSLAQNANSQNSNTNTNSAAPQKPKGTSRSDKAKKGEAGGTDTNIKTARSANSPSAEQAAPQAKGGPKSRATACRFHVDNRTPFTIDIYTDGDFRGSVGPWDDVYGYVEYGAALYARADFADGTFLYWKRTAGACPMTWTLLR